MNKMAATVSLFAILSCVLFATVARADVSHLGYNRFGRIQSTRLQRLESGPKPYPASGYRPNRQFNLPQEQPLFPLANQQPQNNKQFSNNFDNLGETQRPVLTYGAPKVEQPQNNNGFNNLAEPQSPELIYEAPAEEQQSRFPSLNQPRQAQEAQNNNGFNNLAEPQSPELIYGAPARLSQLQAAKLRQLLSARLQQQQQPQLLYPSSQNTELNNLVQPRLRQPQPARLQQQQQLQQFYAASQAERFNAQKPARLTDNREDKDDEEDDKTADATTDIETNNKKDDEKKKVETPQTIAYYPAGAFTFVQPSSAAYLAAGLQPLQPVSAAYTLSSPFLQQPFTFAAPAQLQAW